MNRRQLTRAARRWLLTTAGTSTFALTTYTGCYGDHYNPVVASKMNITVRVTPVQLNVGDSTYVECVVAYNGQRADSTVITDAATLHHESSQQYVAFWYAPHDAAGATGTLQCTGFAGSQTALGTGTYRMLTPSGVINIRAK